MSANIVTILGARPQFIKAAPVSRAIAKHNRNIDARLSPRTRSQFFITEHIIHTGQHYDYNMSNIFFEDLQIPQPDYNLGVGSGPHGKQTGEMLIRIEETLQVQKPDWVLVYGDTNSTLAGALAAAKLHIPVGHVEAGLRSFNPEMPEEHNRVLTDHCCDVLFCPSQTAVDNLKREGLGVDSARKLALVGDTMYDALLQFSDVARERSTILQDLELKPKCYHLATVHRPYNTDNLQNLSNILSAFAKIAEPVILPIHPRTKAQLFEFGLHPKSKIQNPKFIDPVGYLDMLVLEENARMILTDSGGMQKEAYFLGVPCLTLRPETEWTETVETGWNILVGADSNKILTAVGSFRIPNEKPQLYGDAHAAERIIATLSAKLVPDRTE